MSSFAILILFLLSIFNALVALKMLLELEPTLNKHKTNDDLKAALEVLFSRKAQLIIALAVLNFAISVILLKHFIEIYPISKTLIF